MRKSLRILFVFSVFMVLIGTNTIFSSPWNLTLSLSTAGETRDLSIGVNPLATDGYDGYDVNVPLAPPSGPFTFSSINDPANPFITMLSTDIRFDDDNEKLWQIHLRRGSIPQTISWDRFGIPSGAGNFFIGFAYPAMEIDAWFDMTSTEELVFLPGQIAHVRLMPRPCSGDTPPVSTYFTRLTAQLMSAQIRRLSSMSAIPKPA
jgi:hypothetical protein